MSKEEIRIYKNLSGTKEKEDFIKDFWKKRDPTPDTEENEVKQEFALRIAYANKWFNERKAKKRGWDSVRGRILLQLGFPDNREMRNIPHTDLSGRLISTRRAVMEKWTYYQYRLTLMFVGDVDGFGVFRLYRVPSGMKVALDTAKRRLDLGRPKPKRNGFKFKAAYRAGKITVKIPVKRVNFEERDGKITAEFRAAVFVYKDYQKIEEIKLKKTFTRAADELLTVSNFEFSIPFTPNAKGRYTFDVVVTDELADEKYRVFCKHRH